MHGSCIEVVLAVHWSGIGCALDLPRLCIGFAVFLHWHWIGIGLALALALRWHCDGFAFALHWLRICPAWALHELCDGFS